MASAFSENVSKHVTTCEMFRNFRGTRLQKGGTHIESSRERSPIEGQQYFTYIQHYQFTDLLCSNVN